jgi:hypothetical protein
MVLLLEMMTRTWARSMQVVILLSCSESRSKARCTSWARGVQETGSPGMNFVLDLPAFGLQGVGSREEHIIFYRKEAKKEIDRVVAHW